MLGRDEWFRLLSHLSRIIDVYDSMNRVMSLGLDRKARRVFIERLDELCNPSTIVDIGCGPGTLTRIILEARPRYVVMADPLPEMLEEAKNRLPGAYVDRIVAVGEHLPLRNTAVDAAVAAFSLRDHTCWRTGLREMARVSRRCIGVLDIRRCRGLRFILQLA